MTQDRRSFLQTLAVGTIAAGSYSVKALQPVSPRPSTFKALAFDAFPIFDPRPISTLAEALFPGNGLSLMNAWRTRQFEYQWLRSMAGQYRDFMAATNDSLTFAATQLKLDMTDEKRRKLISAWSHLKPWPDATEALAKLRKSGFRIIFLSNMTAKMLTDGLQAAKLRDNFEAIVSTDEIKAYKPEPRAYQLGIDRLQLKKEEILFVAFAGWDVAGAKWFGYPTYWVNRLASPAEELGVRADFEGKNLTDLTNLLIPVA